MATRPASTRTPAQLFGLVFGVIYVLVGIAGFFVASEFIGEAPDDKLIVFPVNHMHNIVHILIGGALLFGSTRADLAKSVNLIVGIAYALVAVLGFIGVVTPDLINDQGVADDFLHLATAILAIYFGTAGADATRPAAPPT
jgi:tryptophan-rich sensory protein